MTNKASEEIQVSEEQEAPPAKPKPTPTFTEIWVEFQECQKRLEAEKKLEKEQLEKRRAESVSWPK
jgi:hypothetical protein